MTFLCQQEQYQALFVHHGRSCGSTAASTSERFRDRLQALVKWLEAAVSLALSDNGIGTCTQLDWEADMQIQQVRVRGTQGYIEL